MPTRHRSNASQFIAVIAAVGSLGGCHQESRIPSRPPTSVRLAAVTTAQTSDEALRYSASIIPYAQVDLAFRTSGYVTGVKQVRGADGRIRDIGTGDYVEKGTVLAHVRLEDMKNQVAQAQAQLDQAVAQHTQADQDFGRAKVLFSTQSLTKPDYDQSQQRFNSTLAAVDNAKAALRQAELTLGDSDLKAPFSGVLLNRSIDLGSLVSPSSAAFTIADISSAKATFGVPDYALSRVRLGQQLSIALQDDVTPFVGRVTSISPSADTRNRVFAIEVTVANHSWSSEARHDCLAKPRRKFSFVGSFGSTQRHRSISLGTRPVCGDGGARTCRQMDSKSARSAVGRDPREFDCRRGSATRGESDRCRCPTLEGWRTHRSHSLGR